MRKVKRSAYLFFHLDELSVFDASAFLRGELKVTTESRIEALSLLTGVGHEISSTQLDLLCRLPTRSWSSVAELIGNAVVDRLSLEEQARRGWLLCDSDDPDLAGLLRHEALLRAQQWHPYAALYHFMDRQSTIIPADLADVTETASEDARAFVQRHGPPPEPFHEVPAAGPPVDLPLIDGEGQLYEALADRHTIRDFDGTRALQLQDLSTLLRYTFGCHGHVNLSKEILLLHKTSPSGGSLHPIEAYPLILNVEGMPTGLYHYDVRQHALQPLQSLDNPTASELAVELAGGQLYAGSAHVLVLMTARFFRNQWKYRRRSRTYAVMLMDAGHLSQTFYLVAAQLGLGAFFTAAINGPRVEEALGIEPQREGALAICGCGVRKQDGSDLELAFKPFVPRKTAL